MSEQANAPSSARPMRADARRNYERLLAEAKATFTELGADASLEEVARRAGVGIGTLYRHFPTREALLEALLRDRFDALCRQAQELMTVDPPDQAMLTWLRALLRHASTYRGLTTAMVSTLTDSKSELYASCNAMREAAGALFDRAKQAGLVRRDIAGQDLFLIVHAAAWAGEQMEDPDVVERLLGLIMTGVRTP